MHRQRRDSESTAILSGIDDLCHRRLIIDRRYIHTQQIVLAQVNHYAPAVSHRDVLA